jgi:hypothetical protein
MIGEIGISAMTPPAHALPSPVSVDDVTDEIPDGIGDGVSISYT